MSKMMCRLFQLESSVHKVLTVFIIQSNAQNFFPASVFQQTSAIHHLVSIKANSNKQH